MVKRRDRVPEQEKRQSWRRTRRELHISMSRNGRKWLRGEWKATASTAAEFDGLSPLTTVLGRRLAESFEAREHAGGEELQHDETLDAEPKLRESEPDAEPETGSALAADAGRGNAA
jgi:hypothetical protein